MDNNLENNIKDLKEKEKLYKKSDSTYQKTLENEMIEICVNIISSKDFKSDCSREVQSAIKTVLSFFMNVVGIEKLHSEIQAINFQYNYMKSLGATEEAIKPFKNKSKALNWVHSKLTGDDIKID